MPRFDFNQPTLIVGMGKTGVSCARFLKQKNTPFAIADSRINPPLLENVTREFGNITLMCGDFQLKSFLPFQQFIVSPGVSIREALFLHLQQQGRLILGDVELFAQAVEKPVIAITGSNGKTTVTTLIESITNACGIKAKAGGNLGLPVLDLLTTDNELYILELSSFQLETTKSLKTLSACVLNISEDHMDRYLDIHDYRDVKASIYKRCEYRVINQQEEEILAEYHDDKAIVFTANTAAGNEYGLRQINSKTCLTKGNSVLLSDDEIKLKGRFNYLNILAAMALVEPLQLNQQKLLTAIKNFKGLAHRCEWIATINAVDFYNDSKGTNPGATMAAIESFTQPEILIAGGVGKDADFTELGCLIKQQVKATVLIGTDKNKIRSAIINAGATSDSVHLMDTMQEAVIKGMQLSEPGDVVILSPACASFDMYNNYIERGEDFSRQVFALKNSSKEKSDSSRQKNSAADMSYQDGYQNAC